MLVPCAEKLVIVDSEDTRGWLFNEIDDIELDLGIEKVVFTGVAHRPGAMGVHWMMNFRPGVNRLFAWAMVKVVVTVGLLTIVGARVCPSIVRVICCAVAFMSGTQAQVNSTDPREVKVAERPLVKGDELIAGVCQGSAGGLDCHDWLSRPATMSCPPWEAKSNASGKTMVPVFEFAGNVGRPLPTSVAVADGLVIKWTSTLSGF